MSKRIIVKSKGCDDQEYYDIVPLIVYRLDGEDYDRGTIETIEATATNNSKAIGKLIKILMSKGFIHMPDVKTLIGYGDDVTVEEVE